MGGGWVSRYQERVIITVLVSLLALGSQLVAAQEASGGAPPAGTERGATLHAVSEEVYLDIVAHVLKENGFPAGRQELAADALEGIRVLPGKPKPPPPVGDFSYVEVVGCLTAGPQRTWMLTRASEPVAVPAASTRPSTEAATATPLGTQTFHLLDAMAYAPDGHRGHKMYVRGLLIKLPGDQRMTISSFEMVAPTCPE